MRKTRLGVRWGLLVLAVCASGSFSFGAPQSKFATWTSADTPENRLALQRWGEEFVKANLSAGEAELLKKSFVIGWMPRNKEGVLASAHYDPNRSVPYRIELNPSFWFKGGRIDGTSNPDIMAFVLLHESYHLFCFSQGGVRQGAQQLVPLVRKMGEDIHQKSMSPDIESRLMRVLKAVEEFQAVAYAQERYAGLSEAADDRIARTLHKYSISYINEWGEAVKGLQKWEQVAVVTISKRLGFDFNLNESDFKKPGWDDRLARQIKPIPGYEGCRWLPIVHDYVIADPLHPSRP